MVGICALCRKSSELLGSHFLPAALYKNLRDDAGKIRNPILSNGQTASEESTQVRQPLLCQDCEIRFQQGGENWVLGKRLMPDGSFPLREILQRDPATGTKNGSEFYQASSIAEIRAEQLLYFAASIFWRAAVTGWETPLGHYNKLQIAPEMLEALRKYLMGEAHFPPTVAILLMISAKAKPLQTITLPQRNDNETAWEQYEFYVPGMSFILTSGNDKALSASLSSPPQLIAIDPNVDSRIEKAGREHAKKNTPTQNLQKKLQQP
jgi:hypothetical protein